MKKALCIIVVILMIVSFCNCKKINSVDNSTTSLDKMRLPTLAEDAEAIIDSFFSSAPNIDGFSFDRVWDDYDFRDLESYESLVIPPTADLEIDGTILSGSFFLSTYSFYNYYPTFSYYTPSGTFCYLLKTDLTPDLSVSLSMSECQRIAEHFFSTYVPYVNANDYTRSVLERKDPLSQNEVYEFTFKKRIGDLDTMDYATITVWKDGQIQAFSTSMMGRVQLVENPFDTGAVKSAIEKKFQVAVESKSSLFSSTSYEIKDLSLTVLKDGTPALLITLLPSLTEIVDEDTWLYSKLGVFVVRTVNQ